MIIKKYRKPTEFECIQNLIYEYWHYTLDDNMPDLYDEISDEIECAQLTQREKSALFHKLNHYQSF